MGIKKTLGHNIKQARLSKGLTQQELADLVGVEGSGYVSRIERGFAWPRAELLEKFVKVLDVSAETLVRYDSRKNSKSSSKTDKWVLKIKSLLKNKREKDLQKAHAAIKNLFS